MVPKDLKKLIDALELRVNTLEEEAAFKDQEIQRLEAEVDRLNLKIGNMKTVMNADYGRTAVPGFAGHGYDDYRVGKVIA